MPSPFGASGVFLNDIQASNRRCRQGTNNEVLGYDDNPWKDDTAFDDWATSITPHSVGAPKTAHFNRSTSLKDLDAPKKAHPEQPQDRAPLVRPRHQIPATNPGLHHEQSMPSGAPLGDRQQKGMPTILHRKRATSAGIHGEPKAYSRISPFRFNIPLVVPATIVHWRSPQARQHDFRAKELRGRGQKINTSLLPLPCLAQRRTVLAPRTQLILAIVLLYRNFTWRN